MTETGADVSVVFVPPAFTKDACIEAIDAGIGLLVVITEGVPVQDSAEVFAYLEGKSTRMIGPNCPGIITPGESLAGITPHTIAGKGPIGLVSKSGTLTYQMMYELRDFGFTTAIGIGGDPVVGTTHIDALEAFEADPETKAIVMIGEIGGDAEERAAAYIKDNVTKPVVGYVAGFTAPEGKTMGHAGAIVSGSSGTAAAKKEALEAVGVKVGKTPSETAALMREILQEPLSPSVPSANSHDQRRLSRAAFGVGRAVRRAVGDRPRCSARPLAVPAAVRQDGVADPDELVDHAAEALARRCRRTWRRRSPTRRRGPRRTQVARRLVARRAVGHSSTASSQVVDARPTASSADVEGDQLARRRRTPGR